MSKILLALIGAPLLLSNAQPAMEAAPTTKSDITYPDPYRGSFEAVPKIECAGGLGSGVRISDDIVISARHVVTGNGPCGAYGQPLEVAHVAPGGIDFVALRGDFGRGLRATYSCEGVIAGERYYAYGYAHGGSPNMEILVGTSQKLSQGRVAMRGRVYPGMSGGAVKNSEGAVVAITVQYNPHTDGANVVDLKATYLCA